MIPLPREELNTLLEQKDGLCVSLYMPAVRAGDETRQNPARYKNLLRQAEERLEAAGMRSPEARRLLQPAVEMLNDEDFWRRQSDGLALFIREGFQRLYRLPLRFDEKVFVARRFHIKPLLPLYSNDGSFLLLVLSQNEVRLLKGSRYSVEELDLGEVPTSLREVLRYDDPERNLRWHSTVGPTTGGQRRFAQYHGQGAGSEEEREKDDIIRFLREVDKGLSDLLKEENIPLVLAGPEFLQGAFRQTSSYARIAPEGITGNQEGVSEQDLHARAWEILQPVFRQQQEEALDLYRRLAGKQEERASDDIEEIAGAAYFGRVGQLFVQERAEQWGYFLPQTGRVRLHAEDRSTPDDMDLLDFAAAYTFINRGEVYIIDPGEMPTPSACAAVLRY